MKFSEKLQTLRKERKMSQEQLADELEVSRQSVSKWESGTTYPEMDKLLGICKIFNCTLDELTNDSIKEINISSNEKNTIDPVKIVIDYFKKMIDVIINMSFEDIIKCCITMFIVCIFISLVRIPLEFIEDSMLDIYRNFNSTFANVLMSFTSLIFRVIYCIAGLIIFFYIFKIKYMDNPKKVTKVNEEIKEEKEIKEDVKEKVKDTIKEENNVTIIKKNKNPFLDTFITIVIYFIKTIIFLCAIPFVFTLIGLAVVFIISILIISKGIVSIGLILTLLSLMLLNIFGLQIVYYFIFNRKVNVKGTFVIFISSIILLGVGAGTFTYELSGYNYINEMPPNATLTTTTFNYEMADDLIIHPIYGNEQYEYIIDENLNNVVVEVTHYNNYNEIKTVNHNNYIYFEFTSVVPTRVIKDVLKDIGNKKIYNYNEYSDIKIKIYANKENVKTLKDNYNKHTHKFIYESKEDNE